MAAPSGSARNGSRPPTQTCTAASGPLVRSLFHSPNQHHFDQHRANHIPTTEALEAATASLSVEAQKRAAKDAQKKTAKAEAAEAKHADKMAKSVITIKRIERNKKKFVTAVIGLEAFDLELKKVRHTRYYLGHALSLNFLTNTSSSCRSPKISARSSRPVRLSQRFPAEGRRSLSRVMSATRWKSSCWRSIRTSQRTTSSSLTTRRRKRLPPPLQAVVSLVYKS